MAALNDRGHFPRVVEMRVQTDMFEEIAAAREDLEKSADPLLIAQRTSWAARQEILSQTLCA